MKRTLASVAAVSAIALLMATAPAHADEWHHGWHGRHGVAHWRGGSWVGGYGYIAAPPVYYAPPPVYYAAPAYYAPPAYYATPTVTFSAPGVAVGVGIP